MRILRKINKGLILTIIVLISLTIYCINTENQRKKEKIEIEKLCKEYLEFANKYLVLPEERQTLKETIVKEDDEYIKEMGTELQKIMISNKDAVDLQHDVFQSYLRGGYGNNSCRTKLDKTIEKIEKYEFDGNQVTVNFRANVTEEIKYLNLETKEEQTKQNTYITYDEVILQKDQDKWKVVYSNLQYNSNMKYGYEDSMILY